MYTSALRHRILVSYVSATCTLKRKRVALETYITKTIVDLLLNLMALGESLQGFYILKKVPVVICDNIGYNINNLRCAITLVSFEPTFTLNGIPILPSGCQALTRKRIGREGKKLVAVTHLALLGVKKQEAAFWGNNTNDKSSPKGLLF